MIMPPRAVKLTLTAHVVASVGWIGAVVTSLILALIGRTSGNADTVRAAYISLELVGRFVLVPLAFAALLSGLVQSLGTAWGLFRHYWVLAKLFLTVFATTILLMYTETLGYLAGIAAEPAWSADDVAVLQTQSVVIHAAGALVVLLAATVFAIYKPRGMTAYGHRKQRETA